MSHGHTKIPSKGACIYCGRNDTRRTDEHVVPFSLGGQHVLLDASCDSCADITKRFEQDVAREMWGDARNSFNAPTRRKKQRKTHIVLTDPNNPQRTVKVFYSEYPAAMVFYKMQRAGMLEGMPDAINMSGMWQFVAVCDNARAKEFEQRFGIKLTAKFRHVPDSFARLLAKIAYCHTLCTLEPGDFRSICVPYILGERRNPSYIVGGTFDLPPPDPDHGYVLNSMGFIEADRLMLMAEIRLFANLSTPTYHVVVGDIRGSNHIKAALDKLGPTSVLGVHSIARADNASSNESHWMPRVSPLPFWASSP
jgi:hypothetical protein